MKSYQRIVPSIAQKQQKSINYKVAGLYFSDFGA